MSAKLRLPPGLQTATFIAAVLAFAVLTAGVSLTAINPSSGHAATRVAVADPG